MAKKDNTINIDINRDVEKTPASSQQEEKPVEYTKVKNANASGVGSMGRNSEEPTGIEINKDDNKV